MCTDPRTAWLDEHRGEIGALITATVERGLSRSDLAREVVDGIMAMTTPPPGGRRTALLIAQFLDATIVDVTVPDAIPEWMNTDDGAGE